MKPKKKKRKLRISGLIFILLVLYIIAMLGYYLFTMPIKRIIVNGNVNVTEHEILKMANISVETSVFKASSSSIKKRLKEIPLIDDVKIKKSILGTITITIEENKLLFYDVLTGKLYLSNENTIAEEDKYIGYPTLVNYVPSDILKSFIKGLSKIDEDIIAMISEIEYSPDKYNDVVIDDERFLLRMNDGNIVYINIVNIEKLNRYQTIYASVGSGGILYLDSSSENYIFDKDGDQKVEEEKNED
ncbi:MAG: FtsQ-type POTRA domain-containing protein [Bacilli bacterium]|nr:FtsQ-type POTRA domain-containing protein [Bacilli bacterium]